MINIMYGAQNEAYKVGWGVMWRKPLMFKWLCAFWKSGGAKRNVYVGLILVYV